MGNGSRGLRARFVRSAAYSAVTARLLELFFRGFSDKPAVAPKRGRAGWHNPNSDLMFLKRPGFEKGPF